MYKHTIFPLLVGCLLVMSQVACGFSAEPSAAASASANNTAALDTPMTTIVPTVDLANLVGFATPITPSPTFTVTNTPAATATPQPTATAEESPVDSGLGEQGGPEGEQGAPAEGGQGGAAEGGGEPDFAAAAASLGVTEDALVAAMDESGQPPDFATAAATLGVTEEALMEALGISGDMPPAGGGQGGQGGQGGGPGEQPPSN